MEEIGVRPSRRGAKGSRSTRVENRVRRRRSRCHPAEFVVGPGSPAGGSTQSSPDGRGVDFRHERPCAHPQSGGPPVRVSAGVHLPAQRLGSSASVVRPRPLPHSGGARGQSPSQPGGQRASGRVEAVSRPGLSATGFRSSTFPPSWARPWARSTPRTATSSPTRMSMFAPFWRRATSDGLEPPSGGGLPRPCRKRSISLRY